MAKMSTDELLDAFKEMTLLELSDFVKAFEETFDGIFCWNTSFGYFEEEKNSAVAQRIFRALRPGGMFLLDVANRDFVALVGGCPRPAAEGDLHLELIVLAR